MKISRGPDSTVIWDSQDRRIILSDAEIAELGRRLHRPERENVNQVTGPYGTQWECEAGQRDEPIGCERHRDHHWCTTCQGYYGVPHDGIHSGDSAHPWGNLFGRNQCACRPCKIATGREPKP